MKSFWMLAACLAMLGAAEATQPADRATVFDLQLGLPASELMAAERFVGLACGSDDGPAMQPVADWTDFDSCPADKSGLHEITFRYDDAAEKLARARRDVAAAWALGTSLDYFPVIVSALFNDSGVLVGTRIFSDARYDPAHETFLHLRPRQEHYLLGLYLMDRFGMRDADCHDIAPSPGERPMLGMFVKRWCELVRDGVRYTIDSRLLRRRGESDVDPVMGQLTEGQFLSETRAEIRLVSPG